MTVNGPDKRSGTIYWHEQDGAELYQSDVHLFGEGEFERVIDLTSSSNQFLYSGQIFVGPQPNHIAAGAIFENTVDNGGVVPNNPAVSYAAIAAITPRPLATGIDLNNLNACGYFGGSGILHTPASIGANFVKVQIICSSNNSYVTQVAYLMTQSTAQQQRTWQRMEDNGVWGAWRELVWADQLPLSGSTGALAAAPIAPGTCTQLFAAVPGARANMAVVAAPAHSGPMKQGLHWDTAYVDESGRVIVPVCNETSAPITPDGTASFVVRVIP